MFSLLLSEIFTVVKQAVLRYYVAGLLTFLLALSWRIWKYVKLYEEFPYYSYIPNLLYYLFTNKIPKHIPFNSFLFQKWVETAKQFQNEGMFFVWLPKPHLVIFNEEAVKILSNHHDAIDKNYSYDVVKEIFRSGLLTSNSSPWRKQRKLLNPVFHMSILKSKLCIFNENADILVKKLKEIKDSSSIDLIDYLKPCAFGSICEYTLGLKMNRPENKELIENYVKRITNLGKMLLYRIMTPWLRYQFTMNFFPSGRQYLKDLNDVRNVTRKLILEMKENIVHDELHNIDTKQESKDEENANKSFTHILLKHQMENPSFTMEDLENQVTTFLAAGFHTVAYTIMWCLFMLGHHPDVQEQAYNEVQSLSDGHIVYEDLLKLTYLDCVIKETLRIYPTVPVYNRRINKDIQCGKYNVPEGTSIAFFVYQLHRNSKIFPDPETFNPDRFMEKNLENLPWNFTPFAEGIRYCIGKKFALMEIKVVLAHVLRHFQITSLDKREEINICLEIVLAPAKPLRFKLTPRE